MSNDQEPDDQPLGQVEQRFAANLRTARERSGLSQETVAAQMQEVGYPAFRQQTVARIEGGSRAVRLGEALALARITGSHVYVLSRPLGLAMETWRIVDGARELRESSRAITKGIARATEAHRRLSLSVAAAEENGHAQELADELFVARRAMAETRLSELRALAGEGIRPDVGRLLSPAERGLARYLAQLLSELAEDEGPVTSRQEVAWRQTVRRSESALDYLIRGPEGTASGESSAAGEPAV